MTIFRCLLGLTLLPGMALGGCATPAGQGGDRVQAPGEAILADSGSEGAVTAGTDEEAGALAATPPIADGPVDVDAMYKVLTAELAARRGQLDLALDNYLEVARRTGDPRVAERASSSGSSPSDKQVGHKLAQGTRRTRRIRIGLLLER